MMGRVQVSFSLVTAAITVAFFLWPSFSMLPPMAGDSVAFMPISFFVANGQGWINPFSDLDFAGGGRFVWHGWLQPVLIGWIVPGSWQSIFVAKGLLSALAFCIYAYSLNAVKPCACRIALLVPGALIIRLLNARPEVLAMIWLLLFLQWARNQHARGVPLQGAQTSIACAVLLALLGVTQPTVAILTAVVIGIWWTSSGFGFFKLWRIGTAGLAAILVCILVTQVVHPFGAGEWIKGLVYQGRNLAHRNDGRLVDYYITNPNFLGCGIWVAILTWIGVHFALRKTPTNGRIPTLMLLAILAVAIWYFALRVPPTFYNALVFVVPGIALLVNRPLQRREIIAILIAGFVSSYSLIRVSILDINATFSDASMNRDRVQRALLVRLDRGQSVVASAGAMALVDDPAVLKMLRLLPSDGKGISADFVLMLQTNTGFRAPPELHGYKIVEDRFRHSDLTVMGVPISRTGGAYNFAIYERDGSSREGGLGRSERISGKTAACC
jgi:hypothetical protein